MHLAQIENDQKHVRVLSLENFMEMELNWATLSYEYVEG